MNNKQPMLARILILGENNMNNLGKIVLNAAIVIPLLMATHYMQAMDQAKSSSQNKNTSSHSLIWYKDKVTSIAVHHGAPCITREAEEEIELYQEYPSPLTFELEKLPADWRDRDKRFDSSASCTVHERYRKNPFIKTLIASNNGEQDEWADRCIDRACKTIYKAAIQQGYKHPLPLGSAAHKGFVQTVFRFYTNNGFQHGKKALDEFVQHVGQTPTENDLVRIGSFTHPEFRSDMMEQLIEQLIEYTSIMARLPQEKVESHFKIAYHSRKALEFAYKHVFFDIKDEPERTVIKDFVQHVGLNPTKKDFERIASWNNKTIEPIFRQNPKAIRHYITYVSMMSVLPYEEVAPYFRQAYPYCDI